MDLEGWLRGRQDEISRRWKREILIREDRRGEHTDGVLGEFLHALVGILPPSLGEDREVAEAVWYQATHLYGALALQRGLAAGEVVEELQVLREVVLKALMEDPGVDWQVKSFQRDLLGLNRLLDEGVVRASVAYVDDLFFAHLQGSGVPEGVTPEVEEEIRMQLVTFGREIDGPR